MVEYKLEGDEIIGILKVKMNSIYLCIEEIYMDFIFEVDVKVEVGFNFGI